MTARTYAQEFQARSSEPVRMMPVTTETQFKDAWDGIASENVEVTGVAYFGHGGVSKTGTGQLYFAPGQGNDGTLAASEIASLPQMNYTSGVTIDLHACSLANGSLSAAQAFANSQGVPATERTGYAYMSESATEYKKINSKSTSFYLDAFARGRNSYLGNGQVQ